MSGTTCDKKVLCCSQSFALGQALDATLTELVSHDLTPEQEKEINAVLDDCVGMSIEGSKRGLKRLGAMIERDRGSSEPG